MVYILINPYCTLFLLKHHATFAAFAGFGPLVFTIAGCWGFAPPARLACIWAMTLQLAEADKPRWIDDIQEIDNAWNIKTVESLAPVGGDPVGRRPRR